MGIEGIMGMLSWKKLTNKTETNSDTENKLMVARWEGVGECMKNMTGIKYKLPVLKIVTGM